MSNTLAATEAMEPIDWLTHLRGDKGVNCQRHAYEALGNYLYMVAFNYLSLRQPDVPVLVSWHEDDLSAFAEEFVQGTLEKLARDNHAQLAGYRGAGRFTSWMAVILRHAIAKELKKQMWRKGERIDELLGTSQWSESDSNIALLDCSLEANPAAVVEFAQVEQILDGCLATLNERERTALINSVVEEEAAIELAQRLNTSANSVYVLVHRAKHKMKLCLQSAGIDAGNLQTLTRG